MEGRSPSATGAFAVSSFSCAALLYRGTDAIGLGVRSAWGPAREDPAENGPEHHGPDCHDDGDGDPSGPGAEDALRRLGPALGEDAGRNQRPDRQDAEGDEEQVVEQAQDRDEVR